MALIRHGWIAVAVLVIAVASLAHGQDLQPFGPVPAGTLADAQAFAPADLSTYGNFPRLNTGIWFEYQRIYWAIHQPSFALIGNPAPAAAGLSDADNTYIKANYVWGNRFDLGYMLDENNGWASSIIKTNDQISTLKLGQTHVGFLASDGTPEELTINNEKDYTNVTRLTGIDLMKVYRYDPDDHWGVWELSYGARFLQVHDRFDAEPGNGIAAGLVTNWDMGIDNDIIGPQIGARWWNQRDRWIFNMEARFTPGANFQNAALNGSLINTNTAPAPTNSFNVKEQTVEFAPLGEFRIESSYKVTEAIALKVGYSAMLVSGIGRASRRIDYTFPDMGIVDGARHDHLFANGLTFGFEINR